MEVVISYSLAEERFENLQLEAFFMGALDLLVSSTSILINIGHKIILRIFARHLLAGSGKFAKERCVLANALWSSDFALNKFNKIVEMTKSSWWSQQEYAGKFS